MRKPVAASRKRRQRGSSIFEFSLVLLPLLAILFLTLDLAWILFAWACVQEGVREGVRFAITGHKDADIAAVVQTYSFGFVKNAGNPNPIQVLYYSSSNPTQSISGNGSTCSGNIVKVLVSGVTVTPLAPLWHDASSLPISSAAADLVEANSVCR